MIHLLVVIILLAGCTLVYIGPANAPVNVQTSNSTDVLGSQNVAKDDTEATGDVSDGDGASTQGAQSTPTATIQLPVGETNDLP